MQGRDREGEQSAGAGAPVGLPSVLLIHAKKSVGVELWLGLVQRYQIVLHGFVMLALLLVDETHVVVDGAGLVFHLGGALQLSEWRHRTGGRGRA